MGLWRKKWDCGEKMRLWRKDETVEKKMGLWRKDETVEKKWDCVTMEKDGIPVGDPVQCIDPV